MVVSATPGAVPAGTRVAGASPTAPAPTAGNLCRRRSAQHTATAAAANVAAERPAVKVTDGKTSPAAAAR
ncbi:hypothetical protein ABB07_20240 [Streptomyces incarnatus]|uniref:Uncharacterized protein n=1 Tax=Streptomyces incarnatus TaxID=665007 RepID=A0ABM5TMN5_9ACTN|nr:hypothetical protein [Streptomyces incarnatus]AKJ12272.1 hypothetical protein ABB07_20240 [Streptomyces incarnatus]